MPRLVPYLKRNLNRWNIGDATKCYICDYGLGCEPATVQGRFHFNTHAMSTGKADMQQIDTWRNSPDEIKLLSNVSTHPLLEAVHGCLLQAERYLDFMMHYEVL